MLRMTQSIYLIDNFYEMVDKKEFQNFCKHSTVGDYENIDEVLNNNTEVIENLKGRKQYNVRLTAEVSDYLDNYYMREKTAAIIAAFLLFKSKKEN